MPKEFVQNGKLDRAAAAEVLQTFLEKVLRAGHFELTLKVRTVESSGGTDEGEAEIFADLDGKVI